MSTSYSFPSTPLNTSASDSTSTATTTLPIANRRGKRIVRSTTPPQPRLGQPPIPYQKKNGPLMIRSARKTSRLPLRRKLAERDEDEEEVAPPPKRRATARRWDWLPEVLARWRTLEGAPPTGEIGESSRPSPPLPATGEPMEATVPTLVVRVNTLDHRWEMMSEDLQALEQRIETESEGVRMELGFMRSEIILLHSLMGNLQADIADTHQAYLSFQEHVLETEAQRQTLTPAAMVSLTMSGLALILGIYSCLF